MKCLIKNCDATKFKWDGSESTTLVGYEQYIDKSGVHNHDDNCLKRQYICNNNHVNIISIIRSCSNPKCNWKGKTKCFCHKGNKMESWPNEEN